MIKSIIVAMGRNRIIGANGKIPWHIPADLKHFKEITMGHPVIMGRKTYESIGKALPRRMNIVVSRQTDYLANGCTVANSLQQAISLAEQEENEVFFIGGSEIYKEALDKGLVDRIYLTMIDKDFSGDTFFPKVNASEWEIAHTITRFEGADDSVYRMQFSTFMKR